jgi:hypothetical protein
MNINTIGRNDTIYIREYNLSTKLNKTFDIRELDFWDYSLLICVILGFISNSLSIIVISSKKLRNTNASLFVIF